MRRTDGSGFTLIEVLIVVVALAVLAGIAVPLVRTSVEKARKAEAIMHLSSLRQSEMRYYAEQGTFTASVGLLDYDPNVSAVAQNPHFTYTLSAAASTTFSAVATRNTADSPPAAYSAKTVTINEAGAVGGTYP